MNNVDLTAIVESVARDAYERKVKETGHADRCLPWSGEAVDEVRDHYRSLVTPTVRATLTALMPLADGWESMAQVNDAQGDTLSEQAETLSSALNRDFAHTASQRAYTARDVHKSCARALRGVLS